MKVACAVGLSLGGMTRLAARTPDRAARRGYTAGWLDAHPQVRKGSEEMVALTPPAVTAHLLEDGS